MIRIAIEIDVQRDITLPSTGRIEEIDISLAVSDTRDELMVSAEGSEASADLISSIDDGETVWLTCDEHLTRLPRLLCRQINAAIDHADSTLQALADLDAEEVAR